MKIAGANLVITGGASGLGLHMATQFAALGGRIAILDRDQAALDNLPETLSDAVLCRCDLTDPAQVERSFRDLSDRMGRLHVLINNAGILFSAPLLSVGPAGLIPHSVEDWEKVRSVNLDAVFYASRSAAEQMVRTRTKGAIINISSVSAAGNAGQSAYSASKAAVEALTVTWAKELGPWGIRVSAVAPGYTDLPSTRVAVSEHNLQEIARESALGRLATPAEIADAVRFLIENDFVTGSIVRVDGGFRI